MDIFLAAIFSAGALFIFIFLRIVFEDKFPRISRILFRRRFFDNPDSDDSAAPLFRLADDFPDIAAPEHADNVIGEKFSALQVGPFNARIRRQMVAVPGISPAGSFTVATIFQVDIIDVNTFAFQIEFSEKYSCSERQEPLTAFYRTLTVNCSEPELLSLLQSKKFLGPVRALNAMAAGRICASGSEFSIALFVTLNDEAALDDLFAEANILFEKYAQLLQLNVLQWRMNAVNYDWWAH